MTKPRHRLELNAGPFKIALTSDCVVLVAFVAATIAAVVLAALTF